LTKEVNRRSEKVWLPPGSLVHVGQKRSQTTKVRVLAYSETEVKEGEIDDIEEIQSYREAAETTWVIVEGLGEIGPIRKLGSEFRLDHLVLEDILATDQRPKTETYGDYTYIVLKVVHYDAEAKSIDLEQVSLILGPDYLISILEKKDDVFDPIQAWVRDDKGSIRKMGMNYLAYALIDAVIDHYFAALEQLGEEIERLEEELVSNPTNATLQVIHKLKRTMIRLRKSIWPLREVVSRLERREPLEPSTEANHRYLRDIYDHTIRVMDTVETSRDLLSGMLDMYLSSVSNRMNDIMKILTVISTIFIPLSLLTGLYGMNFAWMPELELPWAYPALLASMLIIGIVMMVYFRKKGWV
jgi:magnesium transporter